MKTFSNIFLVCVLAACSKPISKPSRESVISVIDDRTDSFVLHPNESILQLYHFQDDKSQTATFRYTVITDMQLNPTEIIHLQDAAATEAMNTRDDINDREHCIYSFCDSVRNTIVSVPQRFPAKTMQHSECFATIATELTWLSNSRAQKRTLIIYGDLQENSDVYSSYTDGGKCLLNRTPQKVATLLLARHPLPVSLAGVTIYFVYKPVTRVQDQQYAAMAIYIYTPLLRAKGAEVFVQAHQTFQP